MSHFPPPGSGAPPPYYGHQNAPQLPPAPGYTYVPAPVVLPMPVPYPHQPPPQPTYVTNHYYPSPPPQPETVTVVNHPPVTHVEEQIEFVPCTPTTAPSFSHRAVKAGTEGWDGSLLWVIRAHHSGDLVPGKLAVKHRAAFIPHGGKELHVHNFELLCAPAHLVRWVPSSNGQVPAGAIPVGHTHKGEMLYVGRVKHMNSLTPGKIHPSHGCLYISFGGSEIPHRSYEVLCQIVG